MKWLLFLFPALLFSCITAAPREPLPVVCSDASGILYEGEAGELLHLVSEGYWEFFDYQARALVRVHENCRFVGK